MEMASVDEQVKEIHKGWDEYTQPRVKIIETESEGRRFERYEFKAYREAPSSGCLVVW